MNDANILASPVVPGPMQIRRCIITGASASGKDHLVHQLETYIGEHGGREGFGKGMRGPISVHTICTDSFYKNLTPEEIERAHKGEYNFDEPAAIDGDSLVETVERFSSPTATEAFLPVYDFAEHRRTGQTRVALDPDDKRRIILIQGIFPMCFERLRGMSQLSVFLMTDPDVQVVRRIHRDCAERGRNINSVINQYQSWVKPGFEKYVLPQAQKADLVIQYNYTNHVVIEMIALQLLMGAVTQAMSPQLDPVHKQTNKST